MRLKKHDHSDNENLDRWLLTYADMITLLLALFVVMYSISQVDSIKFRRVAGALTEVLRGSDRSHLAAVNDIKLSGLVKNDPNKGDLIALQKRIAEISSAHGFGLQINSELQKRGLVVHISESAFFDLGKADLKPQARKILDLLADELLRMPNHVRIEGHTDNLPITTPKFPSNWELSTARATTCVRYLIEKHRFPPERISALGYAEYRPLATNDTPEGRNRNRRVDIVILSPDDSFLEPANEAERGSPDAN